MAENWTAIAGEIKTAIASVGFSAWLETQCETDGPEGGAEFAQMEEITVIDDRISKKDADGVVTVSARMLTIAATGTRPQKGWRVQVRGEWHRIARVMPTAPGGVDLMFDLELEG